MTRASFHTICIWTGLWTNFLLAQMQAGCNPCNTCCRLPQSHTKFDASKEKTLLFAALFRPAYNIPVKRKSKYQWLFHSGTPHTTLAFIRNTRQLYHQVTVTCGHLTCDVVVKKVQCIVVCLENDVPIISTKAPFNLWLFWSQCS